ncbi:APC family permease [Corynebacterium freneyi]|uniref:APC family permease n=1 Tax=Corynebacterium freneyi TaxID=134034 RepID=UPI001EF234B4|nr:APC family permease [Corynebacterium freneyi]MCG7439938.1 APC family permease [Corynebacterium freneyi]
MSELKKTIGPGALIAIGAAGVIGSSYLYLSSTLFDNFTFGGVVIGMVIATFLAACVAIGISELTAMFPRAGGELVYSYVGFGSFAGFLVGWLLICTYIGIVAFYVTATGQLLSTVFPELLTIPLYDIGGGQVYLPILIVGAVMLLIMLGLNWFGAELSFGVQLFLFVILVVIGAAVTIVGFTSGSPDNATPIFGELDTGAGLLSAFAFVVPALGFLTGFSIVAVLAEEANVKPRRLGAIVIASVVVAGLFYAIIFAATGWIIPWTETAQLTNGTIEAFQVAGFPVISWAAFGAGVLGILTTVIAVFASSSRLLFSLARVGLLPPFLGKVDPKHGVPRNALLFTTVVGFVLGAVGPNVITWFLNVGGLNVALVWVVTVLAFYTIRRRHPDRERPYRVRFTVLPALGGIAGLALVVMTLVPASPIAFQSPFEYGMLIMFLLLGAALYFAAPRTLTRQESLDLLLGAGEIQVPEEQHALDQAKMAARKNNRSRKESGGRKGRDETGSDDSPEPVAARPVSPSVRPK